MTLPQKFSPRDFFLWLGAMVALYASAVSFITLLFNYINTLFPDQLDYGYDPYSGGIRFAIASLIIIFPLFIFLMRALHQDIRQNPEKRELGIRRWLIFGTLFIAGATIVGDLVALVYTFLEGEITMRFVLKVLAILLVVGGGFLYFLADLRGRWEKKKKESEIIGVAIAILVFGTIISGFFIIGSPQAEREYRLDEQRVGDLQNIQWQVINYWQAKRVLPASISDLEDPTQGFVAPFDPESGGSYAYRTVGALSFELCANFARATRERKTIGETKPLSGTMRGVDENWEHKEGTHCFARTIDPDFYPPLEKTPVPMPVRGEFPY